MSHSSKYPPTTTSVENLKPGKTGQIMNTPTGPVYYDGAGWNNVSDNSPRRRVVYDLFLFMGQSNCGGNGQVVNLQTDSTDRIGVDLSTTQENVLFSLSTHQTDNKHDTPRYDRTFSPMTPGQTSNGSGSYGAEISFADIYRRQSAASNYIAVKKYYINGDRIEFFDKDLSETQGTPVGGAYDTDPKDTGPKNAWDHILEIWDNIQTQQQQLGVIFNIKGFIWWQGASDMTTASYPNTNQNRAESYEGNLTRLIQNIRQLVGVSDLPTVIVKPQDDRETSDAASSAILRTGVDNIPNTLEQVLVVDTDTFKNVTGYFDGIHWSGPGHLEIGKRVADKMNLLVSGARDFIPSDMSKITSWYDMSDPTDETKMTVSGGSPNKVSRVINQISTTGVDLGRSTIDQQPVVSPAADNDTGMPMVLFDNLYNSGGRVSDGSSPQGLWTYPPSDWFASPWTGEHNFTGDNGAGYPDYENGIKVNNMGMLIVMNYLDVDGDNINGLNTRSPWKMRYVTANQAYYVARSENQEFTFWPPQDNISTTQTSWQFPGIGPWHSSGKPRGGNPINGWRFNAGNTTLYGVEAGKSYLQMHRDFQYATEPTDTATTWRMDKFATGIPAEEADNWDTETWFVSDGYVTQHVELGLKHAKVGEVIFYNDDLTTDELNILYGYVAHKWGLLEMLPDDHPYKELPPQTQV